MRTFKQIMIIAVLTTTAMIGGGQAAPDTEASVGAVGPFVMIDEIIGIVNDKVVTYGEIAPQVEEIVRSQPPGMSPEQLAQLRKATWTKLFNDKIDEQLLLEIAEQENIVANEDLVQQVVAEDVARSGGEEALLSNQFPERLGRSEEASLQDYAAVIRKRAKIQEVIGRRLGPPRFITPKELGRHYKRNIEQYRLLERVRVRQVLIQFDPTEGRFENYDAALTLTRKLHQQVAGGARSIEEVAREHGDGPYADQGGLISLTDDTDGWVQRGQLRKDLETLVFATETGACSAVIEPAFDEEETDPIREIFFVRVDSREASRLQTFKEVQNDIRTEIRNRELATKRSKLLRELRKEAYILALGVDLY